MYSLVCGYVPSSLMILLYVLVELRYATKIPRSTMLMTCACVWACVSGALVAPVRPVHVSETRPKTSLSCALAYASLSPVFWIAASMQTVYAFGKMCATMSSRRKCPLKHLIPGESVPFAVSTMTWSAQSTVPKMSARVVVLCFCTLDARNVSNVINTTYSVA
jgi:hypothetical protein